MTVAVRPARDERERAAALALRRRVFCEEQGVPLHEELDGRDGDAVHLVAVDEQAVLGTCRLLIVRRICLLSRMAVERGERGRGIAGELLRAADEQGRAGGAQRIALHAQLPVESLYAAHGYLASGEVFVEAGIEHIAMSKAL